MRNLEQGTQQVIEALRPVAEKIGTASEKIYASAVKDCVITGNIQIMWVWVFATIAVSSLVFCIWSHKNDKDDERFFSFFAVILFVCLSFAMYTCAQHNILNPEYAAFKNICSSLIPRSE